MTPLEAAQIAQAVYSTPPAIGSPSSSARAALFGGSTVAFPGTDNIACWLADLDAIVMAVPGFGRLHAGFWEAWLEIRPQVMSLPAVDVTVGHSEGAALALLAAANLAAVGRPPAEVWAFEPPRITCDGTLAELFASEGVKLHLYRNGNDVVPIVPRLLQRWQHPAPLISIGKPSAPFPNVDDHRIANVVSSLSNPGDIAHVQV